MKSLFKALALCSCLLSLPVLADNEPTTVTTEATTTTVVAPTTDTATVAAAETVVAPAPAATPSLNAGDTAWMLTSTALVLFMTIPGLALFYSGMVRKKNVLATLMQSFAITALASIIWMVAGYSLAFTPGSPFIGGLDKVFLKGVELGSLWGTIPESVWVIFQMTFAVITPALITGAFAERMKFSAMLWFTAIWLMVVYVPITHWVWESTGWLFSEGVLDYAGGTVVHINAGVAGLVAALVLGKRQGFGKVAMPPHNLVLTIVGASMLWVGWFGFNAGSAGAANDRAGMAMAVTQIAAAAAALSWMFAEWLGKGKPSVLGIASGAVAGLVCITPAAGFVGPMGALIMGLIAGVVCFWGATGLKHLIGYDDSLDAFGVHGVGGILGAILTGVFAVKSIGGTAGLLEGNAHQVWIQCIGTLATMGYTLVVTFVILKVLDLIIGLRVTEEQEREGLDLSLHGERIE